SKDHRCGFFKARFLTGHLIVSRSLPEAAGREAKQFSLQRHWTTGSTIGLPGDQTSGYTGTQEAALISVNMSRPSSRAIYCKLSASPTLLSSPLGQAPQTPSSPPPRQLSKPNLASAAPVLDSVPTVHRKEYSQSVASEPTLLQHRVEVSTPGPQAVSE
ncbi:hypothetical protein U0070_025891, partial [Myodes glareolus]